VLAHVDEGPVPVRVAAIDAVGMLGDTRADGFLIPLLTDDDAAVRTAAAYALSRAGSDRALEAVTARAGEKDVDARRAGAAAAWRCAGVRKKARTTKETPWDGDARAVAALDPLAADADPETRLFAMRALCALWPKTLEGEGATSFARDKDPRIVADFLFRLTANGHDGPAVLAAGVVALDSPDPLVRETAAETLGKVGGKEAAGALRERAASEPDGRVRGRIAIALAACGDADAAVGVLGRTLLAPADAAERAATEAKVLLASKQPESTTSALAMLRDPKTPVLALEALLEGFGDVDATPELEAALRKLLAHPDPVVRGSAASLIGDKKLAGLAKEIEAAAAAPRPVGDVDTERDARQGVLEAKLALDAARLAAMKDEGERKAQALELAKTWDAALRREPSAGVRRALLEKVASTGLSKQMPTLAASRYADLPRNDWRGLPRPKAPILDLDLSRGTGRLTEEEVLKLAARIVERGVLLAVETEDLGVTTYRLDAGKAPVHAASTVIAAVSGVYDGTPWHRVVPAFVIQGADPRGDGSGDAGWLLPDEITRRPFRRGALGMPKGVKDTGGCQLFAMHGYAPHLDGKYTAFGEVVSGQEVVDRIRVGDRIRSVRLVESPQAR
jgi:cyclophilin family peptidyl-prolyl cis-trans isomerase/HEAT repeat protein